ncbi:hypothetical protein BLOT_010061 [Blomia tropicalis]|nr:hypothetical protein BLOT_010061 [Blomia tropicalis]
MLNILEFVVLVCMITFTVSNGWPIITPAAPNTKKNNINTLPPAQPEMKSKEEVEVEVEVEVEEVNIPIRGRRC